MTNKATNKTSSTPRKDSGGVRERFRTNVDNRSFRSGFKTGALHAAEYASSYDACTTHGYRLGDCILSKMNLRKKPPRRNLRRIDMTQAALTDAVLQGCVIALAEIVGQSPMGSHGDVRSAARGLGVTLRDVKRLGLAPDILRRLKQAGLPEKATSSTTRTTSTSARRRP